MPYSSFASLLQLSNAPQQSDLVDEMLIEAKLVAFSAGLEILNYAH